MKILVVLSLKSGIILYMDFESVTKISGAIPGKTVAVFAGIHGNERVGVLALNRIVSEIRVKSGTVYFVYANPPAIKENVRFLNKNLNRLFNRNNVGQDYENERARELMNILDECDALLDIHSYNSEFGDQFAISEESGFDILSKMDFPIIASGFSELGDGTDGYMYKNGKIGICLECGTSNRSEEFVDLAIKSIYQFLQYFNCIDKKVEYSSTSQKYFKVKRMVIKSSSSFKFNKEYKDFEPLVPNEVFATDGDTEYIAKAGEVIIFPRPNTKIGTEACIIGEFI